MEAPDGKPRISGASSSRSAPAKSRILFSKRNTAKAPQSGNAVRARWMPVREAVERPATSAK